MTAQKKFIPFRVAAFTLTILLVPALSAAVDLSMEPRSFTAVEVVTEEPSLLLPPKFQQDLVVCNAYGGNSRVQTPMHVKQNGQHIHGHVNGIPYKQCRQMSSQVRSKDKIGVDFGSIQGSFEIGDLPPNDALHAALWNNALHHRPGQWNNGLHYRGTTRCTIALVSFFLCFLLVENAIEAYPTLASLM